MKYNEALERARKELQELKNKDCDDTTRRTAITIIKNLFPELAAESEGERMKKAIMHVLYENYTDAAVIEGVEIAEIAAWLEKQDQLEKQGQEPKKVSIWKHWKDGICGNGEGKQTYLVKMGNTYSLSSCLGFECDYIELSELDNLMLEKQGEKNINHTDIKEKAHQIAWETSKDYDPSLSKEAWCEMAALDMASWLVKQGEQKQTWKPSAAQLIVIKELIENKNTSNVNKAILRGMFDEFKQFTNTHKREIDDAYLQGICDAKHEIEKQGESPRTDIEIPFGANDGELQEVSYYIPEGFNAEIKDDRVVIKKNELKFHIGEWIVDNCGYVWKTEGIQNQFYLLKDVEGNVSYPTIEWVNKTFHLWSVYDAKDGDVLASGQVVFIFKVIRDAWLYCHCSVHNDGVLITESYDMMTYKYFSEVHPATKEQRDLLFEKMKEAGYEFDFEQLAVIYHHEL